MSNKVGPNTYNVGIVADTQYADTEDGTTYDKASVRRYRQSLSILNSAVDYFNSNGIIYGIQLGDVVDGRVKKLQQADRCLEDILTATSKSKHPWSYCVGNHDLDALDRDVFFDKLIPKNKINSTTTDSSPNKLYYDIAPVKGYRFLFIDGYELSTLSPTSPQHLQSSYELLSEKNKNLADGFGPGDWFADLSNDEMKYVPFNGGLGEEQLQWIRNTLHYAKGNGERCIIFSHMPIHSECCRPSGLMWNSHDLLNIIHDDELKGIVVAVIAGHDHDGGYAIDEKGIHHLIPPAPLECEVGQVAYGFLSLYSYDNGIGDVKHINWNWVGKLPIVRPEQWPTRLQFPDL